jgi:hypothetical protein
MQEPTGYTSIETILLYMFELFGDRTVSHPSLVCAELIFSDPAGGLYHARYPSLHGRLASGLPSRAVRRHMGALGAFLLGENRCERQKLGCIYETLTILHKPVAGA